MSISMQNEINALKQRVADLEALLAAKFTAAEHEVESEWDALKARVKSLEASAVAKVKGLFGK